ncbi:uncharacterized protein NPIL_200271 [Nephila pilipes]|uniref:Uncharacterized protein n=1 Tax=Nephila pilipes TaxID=299642 RepID=A0A8X6UJD1_NEPPI|nr:uncharacterized protein NPIL_200271 [Nephila pilipes]
MQKLWDLKTDWTDSLPTTDHQEWHKFLVMLEIINNIDIERRIVIEKATQMEIHGFSDASEHCFGAVVCCKSFSSTGDQHILSITGEQPYISKAGILCCSLTIKVSEKNPCYN